MAAESEMQISLKLMVDKKNNRVVFAESGRDFVDILFSFLTMPMGTIVRLLGEQSQPASIGCFTSLYEGVEDLKTKYLWTRSCEKMLLHPQNSAETLIQKLKLNIDDRDSTGYFTNSPFCGHLTTFWGISCRCNKFMMKRIHVEDSNADEEAGGLEGVFINADVKFIISDDLQVMPASNDSIVSLLDNLGISDMKALRLQKVKVGLEEISLILKLSLLSKSTLTDMFLRDQGFISRNFHFGSMHIKNETRTPADCRKVSVKLIVRKPDNKLLYAEVTEDFVDLLFSFLTVPLGSVVELLGGRSSLRCIDNLYQSVGDSNVERFIGSVHSKAMLLSPKLPPKYLCKNQLLGLEEVEPNIRILHSGRYYQPKIVDPKSPYGDIHSLNGYVKGPATFMVTDNLVVTPYSSISSVAYLQSLNVNISSLGERVISIGKREALCLLKASLISTSALTVGLNSYLKKPKQAYLKKPKQES